MKRGRDTAASTSLSVPTAPATREPFVKRPVAAEVAQSIRHLVIKLVFGEEHINTDRYFGKGQNELPGPLAVAVSRRHLPVLCTQGYMACEKSDGERAMLLLVGSAGTAGIPGRFSIPPGAYLIGRDFDAEAIVGGEQYAPLCCASGGLVLADGELIIRPDDAGSGTNACAVYMVFDCMRWGAEDVGRAPLDVRLQAIADKLRLPCRDEDDRRARAGNPGLPLLLLGKHFVPKARVGTIFACISERPPHLHQQHAAAAAGAAVGRLTAALETEAGGEAPHRLYRQGTRVNGTDGIVFTPMSPSYRDLFRSAEPGCAAPLLKWKFADEHTVDFRLNVHSLTQQQHGGGKQRGGLGYGAPAAGVSRPIQLFLGVGGDRSDVAVARTLLPPDACDAYADLAASLGLDSIIVEAAYDQTISAWSIRRVRNRKTRPNHISTGWSTLEVLSEALTSTELVSVLSTTSSAGSASSVPPTSSRGLGQSASTAGSK